MLVHSPSFCQDAYAMGFQNVSKLEAAPELSVSGLFLFPPYLLAQVIESWVGVFTVY